MTAIVRALKFRRLIDGAGEKAFAQRAERHEADAEIFQRRQDFLFRFAPPERIFALQRGDRLHGVGAADRLHTRLREAEVFDLAFRDQLFDRARDVLDRHVGIGAVLIEEIDAIGVEALQRGLGDLPDALGPAIHALGGIAVLEAELGRNHHLVAERRERFPDNDLVLERPVGLCGVEKGDAALERRADQLDRILVIRGGTVAEAQAHTAKADRRDFQVFAQLALLHRSAPPPKCGVPNCPEI